MTRLSLFDLITQVDIALRRETGRIMASCAKDRNEDSKRMQKGRAEKLSAARHLLMARLRSGDIRVPLPSDPTARKSSLVSVDGPGDDGLGANNDIEMAVVIEKVIETFRSMVADDL